METVKETSRLEAFSDGVFGFAITLLVLDIHVPSTMDSQTLFQAMAADWATYVAFLTGFFTILICWINHHFMFDYIYKSNSKLLLINGSKLLVVTFTPFATAVLSKYINTDQQETAVSVYAFNFALMGMSMFGIWLYAFRMGLMKTGAQIPLRTISRYYLLAAILSFSIFILSFVSIWLCLSLSGLMFVIFLFPEQALLYVERSWARSHRR
jgi:uncharacterized membrane protein